MSSPRSAHLGLLVAAALAAAIVGYAWFRVATFSAATGPRRVQWYDTDGQAIDTAPVGASLGSITLGEGLVLEDRLIVWTGKGERGGRQGLASIDPARGTARIAWPHASKYGVTIEAAAVRDRDTFAVLLHSARDTAAGTLSYNAVGIAGRDGWLREPTTVHEWKAGPSPADDVRAIGMAWIDGAVEVALLTTRVSAVASVEEAVSIVRIGMTEAPVVRSQSFACDCSVELALPGATGWTLVVRDEGKVMLADAAGTLSPAPDTLRDLDGWHWDRSALGLRPALGRGAEPRIERDGTRTEVTTPVPGWEPYILQYRMEWADGALHPSRVWHSPGDDRYRVLARRLGERTVFTSSDNDRELELVGATPEGLRPVVRADMGGRFHYGAFLPRAQGGYYWLTGRGEYVTLDAALHRIDSLSLSHHLRTRGSTGDFIDEEEHVWKMGWALFGLPILLVVALGLAWRSREWRLAATVACVVYAVSGSVVLVKVLPFL